MNSSLDGRTLLDIFPKVNYCDGATNSCLDVRLTSHCDNSCSFCIAEEDMRNHRKFDIDKMIEGTKKTQRTSVSIIGGEPLLFLNKLLLYIDRVKKEIPIVKEFYVTTALPITIERQFDKFEKLMEDITVLNVSIQSLDNDLNNKILQAKKNFNRLELLERLLSREEWKSKIRVHLNLSRGGIDNFESLNQALYALKEMGAVDVKLNELMNAPDDYVSFEEITGMQLPSPYANGCSTRMSDYFPGLEFTLKRSCFIVEPSRDATAKDIMKLSAKEQREELQMGELERVLYEDGELSTHWLNGESV